MYYRSDPAPNVRNERGGTVMGTPLKPPLVVDKESSCLTFPYPLVSLQLANIQTKFIG